MTVRVAAVRPRHVAAAKSPARQQAELALAYGLLVAVVCAMSLAGLGAVARPLYMAAGAAFAWVTIRRSPWLYIAATLWFWLVTAFVRRFIEWRTGFNPTDIILGTPNLMMLFMLPPILNAPGLLRRRELGPAFLVAGAVIYGICVSFFRGDVVPGVVAAADWLAPMFYVFFIAAQTHNAGSLEDHVRGFLPPIASIVMLYALYQYFWLPDWDAQWMVAADMGSIGEPFPTEMRAFGTTNGPLTLAIWSGVSILLAPYCRSRALTLLTPVAAFALGVTLVRSVYGSVALGLLVSIFLSGNRAFRPAMVIAGTLAMFFVGMSVVNPVVADRLGARFTTMQALDSDDSAQVRKQIYLRTPDLLSKYPLGLGIGALGRGAVVSGNGDLVDVDSGPLAACLALGWVGGMAYIIGMLLAVGQALMTARRLPSPLLVGFASAAVCPYATFPFINVNGFSGVVLWFCLGSVILMANKKYVNEKISPEAIEYYVKLPERTSLAFQRQRFLK